MTCHTDVDDKRPGDHVVAARLGGGRDFGPIEGFPGHIRAPNLTPDKDHGLGGWTDGEIVRAMREGVGRDGRALFPIMQYGTYGKRLSDEDALAIVAYLRTLPPLGSDPGRMEVDFPVSMFMRLALSPLAQPAPPAPKDTLARGEWLLEMASCAECHSQSEKGQPIEGLRLAGSTTGFKLPNGITVYPPNLTSDAATGIGSYSDEDILRALNEGIGKNGKPLYVMPWAAYGGMTDDDKKALVAALRKVPAVSHAVPASVKP
jgi:mono/diheme cytochrome c family protein